MLEYDTHHPDKTLDGDQLLHRKPRFDFRPIYPHIFWSMSPAWFLEDLHEDYRMERRQMRRPLRPLVRDELLGRWPSGV